MKKKDTIAVLGYGSQGRAMALNLRDSGYSVTVGLRANSKSRALAKRERIRVVSIPDAAASGDIVLIALPDNVHGEIFRNAVADRLKPGASLVFLHGSSVHFGLVDPPPTNPVLLLAPHAPGSAVRSNYVDGIPYSAFIGVHRGSKKQGYVLLQRLAKAVGIPKTHLIKTTIADEAVGDVFGEQAVLCGGLARLLKYGFETLVEAGLPPQNAYLEVAFQIDLIVDLVKKHGLAGMFDRISPLARYGSAVNGPRVITPDVKRNMKKVYRDIASGKFMRAGKRSGLKPSRSQMEKVTNKAFDRQVKRFSSGK
jgi:ketol-acid reductoisomerase